MVIILASDVISLFPGTEKDTKKSKDRDKGERDREEERERREF